MEEGETREGRGRKEGIRREGGTRKEGESKGEEGMREKEEVMDGLRCCTPHTRRPQEQISKK
jgi:hypothetical protein